MFARRMLAAGEFTRSFEPGPWRGGARGAFGEPADFALKRIALVAVLFVVVAAPMALLAWRTLDELLAGDLRFLNVLAFGALALIFLMTAAVLGRFLTALARQQS